jgi:hypothetical protein
MPKGFGWMIGILFVVTSAVGAWLWHDSRQKPSAQPQAKAEISRVTIGGSPRPDVPTADGATFSLDQFGNWGSTPPERQYEPGEVVVADPDRNFAASAYAVGFNVLESIRFNNIGSTILRLSVPFGMSIEDARSSLKSRFPGLTVDANHHYQPQQAATGAARTARALGGWGKTTASCGGGVKIGMIDGAVDVRHPALSGQDIAYRSFHRPDGRQGQADHGTAIAAMLVGKPEWGGLLPGAYLMAANMFNVDRTGQTAGTSDRLLRSIDWMISERVHAINFSIAGGQNAVVKKIIERLKAKSVALVAAAGNWGTEKRPAYPAADDNVLAVSAFADGGVPFAKGNFGAFIDFAAPGANVFVAAPGGGGSLQSGTSFAVPYITVLAALEVAGGKPGASNALRSSFSRKTIDIGAKGRDKMFGWGFVNVQPSC